MFISVADDHYVASIAVINTNMVLYRPLTQWNLTIMLKISKLSDYAVLLVSCLGRQSGAHMSAKKLAALTFVSAPTVSKLLKKLHDADLVGSSRGSNGGYHLLRSIKAISIADVIVAIEGRPALTECAQSSNICYLDHQCALKNNWKYINESIYTLLMQVSIADMNRPLAGHAGLTQLYRE
jgi:FeS assembly SUF system regulator